MKHLAGGKNNNGGLFVPLSAKQWRVCDEILGHMKGRWLVAFENYTIRKSHRETEQQLAVRGRYLEEAPKESGLRGGMGDGGATPAEGFLVTVCRLPQSLHVEIKTLAGHLAVHEKFRSHLNFQAGRSGNLCIKIATASPVIRPFW